VKRWLYLQIIAVVIALVAANVECMTRCMGVDRPTKISPCHGGASEEGRTPNGCKYPVLVAASDVSKFAPAPDSLDSSLPVDQTPEFHRGVNEIVRTVDPSPPLLHDLRFSVVLRI
jgi:hypothetical protein